MTQVKKRWIWTTAAAVWLVFILIALFMPPPEVEGGVRVFEGTDKLVHAGLFGVWAILLTLASLERYGNIKYVKIVIAIIIVGTLTELIQTFIPDRSGELLDALADIAGGFLVLLAMKMWKRT